MGKGRHNHCTPAQAERMIDIAPKQPEGGGQEREKRVVRKCQSRRKHDAINLPKNLIDSESEESEVECSSEDDNDQFQQNVFIRAGSGPDLSTNELCQTLTNLALNEKKTDVDKAVKQIFDLAKKYEVNCKNKELKSRSPHKNKPLQSLHTKKPFDKHDINVYTPHGTGGRVTILPTLTPKAYAQEEIFSEIPDSVEGFPRDDDILAVIQDFIQIFGQLTPEEQEKALYRCMEQENQISNTNSWPARSPHSQTIMSPQSQGMMSPQSVVSPYTQCILSPDTSPNNLDLYDSSYETGSPCSTEVTSPGSPPLHLSPPRTSLSSESDQELDPAVENRCITNMNIPTTVIISDDSVLSPGNSRLGRPIVNKLEPIVRPRGEVYNKVKTSASQRLYELSKSTSFCIKHFTIQLVRVVMTTKAEKLADKIEGFSKSLLSTMKTKLVNKAHEGDIWQLSIYAHIQFLTAPDRIQYRSALLSRDERGRSLFYIAAVERHEKPLIARYIAESMFQVGISPLEQVDEKGNTILHVVAEQGDSHIHVLSELLMASSADSKPLFNVLMSNKAGQSPLHLAAQSPNPHLTTVLLLLECGSNPLHQDEYKMTALHYQIKHMSSRVPRPRDDVEVVRLMVHAMQAPISLSKDSLQTLNRLCSDTTIPSDITNIILDVIKDMRPKKNQRR